MRQGPQTEVLSLKKRRIHDTHTKKAPIVFTYGDRCFELFPSDRIGRNRHRARGESGVDKFLKNSGEICRDSDVRDTIPAVSTILIIDDDNGLRQIHARYLTMEGYSILEASSSAQALQKFNDRKPDLILLDLRIPADNDSRTLLTSFHQAYPNAKVIISSCYDLDVQKAMVADAEDYFNKSEGCRALSAKIRSVLSRRDTLTGQTALE